MIVKAITYRRVYVLPDDVAGYWTIDGRTNRRLAWFATFRLAARAGIRHMTLTTSPPPRQGATSH